MDDHHLGLSNQDIKNIELSKGLDDNIHLFKNVFAHDSAFIIRELEINLETKYKCAIMFIDGMVKVESINEGIINALFITLQKNQQKSTLDFVAYQVLNANDVKKSTDVWGIVDSMIYGDTILLIEGFAEALVINTKGWDSRSISEPSDEKVLSGPREGFTEAILKNTSLIRRRIKTNDLKFVFRTLGKRTNTKICLCYVDGIVDKKILADLNRRLDKIDIDGILDVNYIIELIKDSPYSIFETTGTTERPDTVAGRILEGRIALIVDGTPVVMTVPYLFIENFQSDDDYYMNFYFTAVGRLLRIISFFLTVSVPALYISFLCFNAETIPATLAVSISSAREGVPFSILIECILMLVVFEILRETGLRMPSSIGHALSIVGGLVIGQAAVEAKLISAPTVILIALAGITGLMLPRLKTSVVILRLVFAVICAFFGLYGFFFCIIGLAIHLFSISSFGVSYMSYIFSVNPNTIKDSFVRAPWWDMKKRPNVLTKNITRQRVPKQ